MKEHFISTRFRDDSLAMIDQINWDAAVAREKVMKDQLKEMAKEHDEE
jgi:hypothetical protein